jgi:hypothetical protein
MNPWEKTFDMLMFDAESESAAKKIYSGRSGGRRRTDDCLAVPYEMALRRK